MPGLFRRRPLFILPSGQGRSSPRKFRCAPFSSRSKAFHRARPTLTTDAIPFVQAAYTRPAERSNYQSIQNYTMTFIQQFETELNKKLEDGTDNTLAIVRWATEKVLESYRNGIKAGREGKQVIRDGKSRRRDSFGNKA
jgi:hypothetical protein